MLSIYFSPSLSDAFVDIVVGITGMYCDFNISSISENNNKI